MDWQLSQGRSYLYNSKKMSLMIEVIHHKMDISLAQILDVKYFVHRSYRSCKVTFPSPLRSSTFKYDSMSAREGEKTLLKDL